MEKNLEEAYLHALREGFRLYASVAILTETAQKLRGKFGWPEDKIFRLLKAIAKVATVLKTRPQLQLLADKLGNRVLECALAGKAELIITGDKHLLSLKQFENTKIISLSEFLEII